MHLWPLLTSIGYLLHYQSLVVVAFSSAAKTLRSSEAGVCNPFGHLKYVSRVT